ncbi:MAG: hypothetical protein V4669_11330 [Pseudomonadota bacterium]
MKKWIPGAAGVVVVFVAIAAFYSTYAGNKPSLTPTNPPPPATAQLPGRIVPENQSVPALAATQPSATTALVSGAPSVKLLAELRESKDWRAFALSARSRPEEGGRFYAMYVTNYCGMGIAGMPEVAREAIANRVATTGTVTPPALEMTNKLSAYCAAFSSSEEATDLFKSVKDAAADNRDPLVAATKRASAALDAKSEAEATSAFKQLFALGDPVAPYFNQMLNRAMRMSAKTDNREDLWFDGKLYSDVTQRTMLGLAVVAASCSAQAPCEIDIQMMLGCLGGQFCTDSRQDYLRHLYVVPNGLTDAQFAEGLTLAGRVQTRVAERRADAFLR